MIFVSEKKGLIIWDKESGKPLAKFVDGRFCSNDADVIRKLQDAGFTGDPEEGDETDDELEALRERAKELGIANAERKGAKRLQEEIAAAEAAAKTDE